MMDVHMYFSWTGRMVLKRIKTLKRLKPARALPYGSLQYPPIVLKDLDDNFYYVHPLNPKFIDMGTRLMDGTKLKPKSDVGIELENGESVVLWKDGESYGKDSFNVANNLKKVKIYEQTLLATHGISVTTQRLKDALLVELKHPNIYVFPNSVIFDDYPDIRTIKKDKGKVRVLWQGGDSHYADWYGIRGGLAESVKRIPNIKYVIWGTMFRWITDVIPDKHFESEPWLPYHAYKLKLSVMDFDIAVAPLVDNIFNRSKSAIKFYEAAALPRPRPTLAARVPPYSDEIEDGVTGMLYGSNEEFVEKLGILANDAKLRDQIAQNAKDWLRQHRCADVTVPPYFEWVKETHARVARSKAPKDLL